MDASCASSRMQGKVVGSVHQALMLTDTPFVDVCGVCVCVLAHALKTAAVSCVCLPWAVRGGFVLVTCDLPVCVVCADGVLCKMKCGSSSSIMQTGVFVCCAVMCGANVGLPGATANLYAMFCGTAVGCLGSIWSGQPRARGTSFRKSLRSG